MTMDREFDRVLDAWFADGPAEAPDRILHNVTDRIDRQVQRPRWRLRGWGGTPGLPSIRLVAAATTLAIVLVGASLIVGGGGGIGPSIAPPSPTPTRTPSQSPATSPALLLAPSEALEPGTWRFDANGGGTTFDVPAGWRVPAWGPLDFALAPIDAAPDDTIRVFYDMRFAMQATGCPETRDPGIGSQAADLMAAITVLPGVQASAPEAITIGGLDGLMVDLAVAPDATGTCPFSDVVPTIPLVVDTIPGEGPFWGIARGERKRLIVLDHPTGSNVVFIVDAIDGATFDDLVAAAMPVLETFRFD